MENNPQENSGKTLEARIRERTIRYIQRPIKELPPQSASIYLIYIKDSISKYRNQLRIKRYDSLKYPKK